MTDPISDMLTRIRNAAMVNKSQVDLPLSKVKFAIAKLLEQSGYLEDVKTYEVGNKGMISFKIKYNQARRPVLKNVKRISKPGRRVYVKANEITAVRSGQGISVISTPNGLMTNSEARKRRLGGEVICEVY